MMDPCGITRIGQRQEWRGPHLRIGNLRVNIRRYISRYKVEDYPDRVDWEFHFYYDRANTFKGDRTISWKRES